MAHNVTSSIASAPTLAIPESATNILAEIVANKREAVEARKIKRPLASFKHQVKVSTRSLQDALSHPYPDFILECKKASPSKGLIRENFDLESILSDYKDFASAISILTDTPYFQGQLDYLTIASSQVNVPILCKDFFIDSYQVYEARDYGADAILLMLSVLDDAQYRQLASVAKALELDVLTEVHTEEELDRALALDAQIIGINNRNLKTLEIDLSVTEQLAEKIPAGPIVISESGIRDRKDVKRLSRYVDGFLIGSSIMAADDIRYQLKSLIFGRVKICGLTKPQDAITLDRCGGVFAGLMFYPKSKRSIDLTEAKQICADSPLRFVGVFVDEGIDTVIHYAQTLNLYAVQIHGQESDAYIAQLKSRLPGVQIWQAVKVADAIQTSSNPDIDYVLLDKYSADQLGGSGQSFDWSLLNGRDTDRLILAGGLNLDNVSAASDYQCFALDLSSGVETEPGVKDADKIAAIFHQLRA